MEAAPKYSKLVKEMNRAFQIQETKVVYFVKDGIGKNFYDAVIEQIQKIRDNYKSDGNDLDFKPIGDAKAFNDTMKNFGELLDECKRKLIENRFEVKIVTIRLI